MNTILPLLVEGSAQHHGDVSTGITLTFSALLVGMIACLALEEKIHAKKSVIVAAFAVICLILGAICGILPFGPVTNVFSEQLKLPVYIPAIDWGVIAIILGSSLFVDVTSKSGLFSWIAIKLTKLSKGDPLKLLIYYCLMTVIFSAVLNNVTAMIIVGSLSGVSLRKLNRENLLLGFLLTEALLTNVGGLLTLISSVPNIIVGETAGISFVEFFTKSSPYVLIATIVTIFMGAKLFKIKGLSTEEEKNQANELVAGFDENDGVESNGFFWFGTILTLVFIGVIAGASQIPYINELGLGFIALTFAAISLIKYKATADKFYQAIDWDLLSFFAGLFVVINVMEHAQVLKQIGVGLKWVMDLGETTGTGSVLVGSAFFSSVTDNIPLAAMLAKILGGIPDIESTNPKWWSVIFGANLGGNLTPIGSASTLMAVTIMHKQKVPLSFGAFIGKALPFALVHIILATAYVLLFLS